MNFISVQEECAPVPFDAVSLLLSSFCPIVSTPLPKEKDLHFWTARAKLNNFISFFSPLERFAFTFLSHLWMFLAILTRFHVCKRRFFFFTPNNCFSHFFLFLTFLDILGCFKHISPEALHPPVGEARPDTCQQVFSFFTCSFLQVFQHSGVLFVMCWKYANSYCTA